MLLRGPLKRVLSAKRPTSAVFASSAAETRKIAQQFRNFTSSRAFRFMQSSLRRISILTGTGATFVGASWFSRPVPELQRSVSTVSEPHASDSISPFKITAAAVQIPHPDKRAKGGEDAYFISSDGCSLGVFDGAHLSSLIPGAPSLSKTFRVPFVIPSGVGGWSDSGVDPRIYALKLAEGSLRAAEQAASSKTLASPVEIMDAGYKNAFSTLGSSTACIVVLRDDGKLSTANVGDSGCSF